MNATQWAGGLLLTFTFLNSPALMAQQAPAPAAAQRGATNRMGSGYKAADPATRAQKMTDRLTATLSLDAATSKKVYDACLTRDQHVDAIQTGADDNKTKSQKLKANADEFKTAIKGILTADQFTRFQAMKHHGGGGGANATGTDPNQ